MAVDFLFHTLDTLAPSSPEFKHALQKELIELTLPKHYYLLEAPRIAEHAYFLAEGFAMRYYFIGEHKQIDSFWKQGDFIFPIKSFMEQVASSDYIQLQQLSTVLCISYKGLHQLFNRFEETHLLYRKITTAYYEASRKRLHDLQHLHAEQRYHQLLLQYPGIEQIVPQELIASYLSITPQSLSRIKRLAQGKP